VIIEALQDKHKEIIMNHIKYSLRTFREGEEERLAAFFNKTYEHYFGFVPRTPQYWKWSYLLQPDIHPEGIFIIEGIGDQEIKGYAVVRNSGVVCEICIHPGVDRDIIVSILLPKIESYARDQGAGHVLISVPPGDKTLSEWITKSGYGKYYNYMVGIPLNFPELIRQIMEARLFSGLGKLKGKFLIHLSKDGRRFRSPSFLFDELFILIEEGKVCAEPDVKSHQADFTIKMDVFTFTSIILGTKSILTTVLRGDIRVTPFWKFYKAVELLSLMVIPYPWYVPLGDRR